MRIHLFSWLFLVPIYYVLLSAHVFAGSGQCPSDQQSLLLQLKKSLTFDPALSRKLVKWNGSDYCSWEGVSCNKQGCVSHLDLSSESISGGLDNSSALFSLQYIENLNLAYNSFNYAQFPPQFNKLINLTNLNLSNAGFAGQVPIEISELTRLVTLDLSTLYFPGTLAIQLENPNLNVLVANLSDLMELHLDGVNISAQGREWCQAVSSSLPKLRVLSLSTCNLAGPVDISLLKLTSLSVIHLANNNLSAQVPEFFSNFTNLTSLYLINCELYGVFPKKIFQVPTLQTIDLSSNPQLQGTIPAFPKDGSLRSLVLSKANFTGGLPDSIGNLKMLSRLDLSYCNFSGPIPMSFADLTELVYVDLSNTKFNGSVPMFSGAKNLTEINISYNELTGPINSTLWGNLTKLVNLDVRHNQLDGSIPLSLFSLPWLKKLQLSNNQFSGQFHELLNVSAYLLDTLDLSYNNLEGAIPLSILKFRGLKILLLSSNNFSGSFLLNGLQQLRNLSSLDLSFNSLAIDYNDTDSSESFPSLSTLKLASGKLRKFPSFMRNQSKLNSLDLSQNQIHGEIPNWIWRLKNLVQLNLSYNSLVTLQGPFPNLTSTLSVLDLHSNQLHGQFPFLPPFATYLDYSSNNFSSRIPTHIGDSLNGTLFLSLSSNKFHGIIPTSICNATYLQVLDFSSNSISGLIPECLTAISGTLAVLNLRRNKLSGSVPDKFPQHCSLKTLDLNGNQIEGQFPKSLANCTLLEVLNLGNNQIKDIYPCVFKSIVTLRVLVLRSNKFYGPIGCPDTNGNWPMLQIVDIAHNNFSGEIPRRCLTTWRAMMADEDEVMSKLNHIRFQVLQFSGVYYQDAITVTSKGVEMELVKILTVFTSIDISCNQFNGSIPEEVGLLKSLYGLNVSGNELTGTIPSALGNLSQLESLDLSDNKLSGLIPSQLADLNFLSFLNVSNNQLVGMIPRSTQISTFPADSFAGNKGLCGPPLRLTCSDANESTEHKAIHKVSGIGFDWQSIYTGVGFGVGAGVIVILLILWEEGRNWSNDSIDRILLVILPMMGYSYRVRDEWSDEEEDNFEEEDPFLMEYFEEDESDDKGFQGPYCVFCSKLDKSRKKAIHDPNCTCRFTPPISSSSSFSSSFSP